MPVVLDQDDTIFTIQAASSSLTLSAALPYLNYDGDEIAAVGVPPVGGDLFTFTSFQEVFYGAKVIFDVYDFMGNTILYSGDSDDLTCLFIYDADFVRNVSIKNLNINVTSGVYATMQGYMIGNSSAIPSITLVRGCHLFFQIDAPSTVAGLIGESFTNGSVTECSCTHDEFLDKPALNVGIGAILGSRAGFSSITNPVSILDISKCYSSINIEGGGIVGGDTGHCDGTGSISSNVTIYNCYSTGDILNENAGGICGGKAGIVIQGDTESVSNIIISGCYSTGNITGGGICGSQTSLIEGSDELPVISNVTIRKCYSTGDISAGGGGIVGAESAGSAVIDTVANLIINSCYSTGIVATVASGGICGENLGNKGGTSVILIDCCYTLNGVIPVNENGGDYSTGNLLGTGALLVNVTSSNNSFNILMDGFPSTEGRVSLTTLKKECANSYYSESRCVFVTGESPILLAFMNREVWEHDSRCLDIFAPTFSLFSGCPINTSTGIEWPMTAIGETVEEPCNSKGISFYRECNSITGTWNDVEARNCYTSKYIAAIAIIVSIFIIFITIAVFALMF